MEDFEVSKSQKSKKSLFEKDFEIPEISSLSNESEDDTTEISTKKDLDEKLNNEYFLMPNKKLHTQIAY